MEKISWKINGEMVLSCNCDVFCPCVASMGNAQPTYGYCQAWAAIKIHKGFAGDEKLDGLNVAFMLDIPGRMSEGNWTAALYMDERANPAMVEHLTSILKGEQGGPPSVLGILVGNVIGVKQVPISIDKDGKNWKVKIPKIIDGTVAPVAGKNSDEDIVLSNTKYWIGPDVHVSQSKENHFRDYGRNWDFTGQSAEYVKVDWASKN
jgi:hypothetical protein